MLTPSKTLATKGLYFKPNQKPSKRTGLDFFAVRFLWVLAAVNIAMFFTL